MHTVEEALRALAARVTAVEREISRLRGYAESTERMHHQALTNLNGRMGQKGWPTSDPS
jgi:hypothetical protein